MQDLSSSSTRAAVLCGMLLASHAYAQDNSPCRPLPPPSPSSWSALGDPAVSVYNNLPGNAKNNVPGLPGIGFFFTTGTTAFDRPFASANGNWILTCLTAQVTTIDEVLIVNGALVAQEGTAAPFEAGQNWGTFNTKCGINASGEYTLAMNVAPSTVNDDYVLKVTAGPTYNVIAREAMAIPYLPGVTYDDTFTSTVISDNGNVGFEADLIDGAITTTTDDIMEWGGALRAQNGITVPPGQAGTPQAWENFDPDDHFVSADGLHYILLGDLAITATTDDGIVVVDGAVVLQENQIIPGSGFVNPIDGVGIIGVSMDPAGNWYARGNNDTTEQDWVVRNGTVVAAVGLPITGGSELWDDTLFTDCFFLHTGNGIGDYVIGGVTDDANPALDGVIVHSTLGVVARESDAIDLDDNGLLDDDAYFNTFGNDDAVLTDAGTLYFTATIKNGVGTLTGQGFFKMELGGSPVVYCTAKMNSQGCFPAIGATGTMSATATSGFLLSATQELNNKVGLVLYSEFGRDASPFGTGGILCVKAPTRRSKGFNAGGTPPPTADCSGVFNIDFNTFGRGLLGTPPNPAAYLSLPGQVVTAQFWGRDPGIPAPDNFSLSNGIEFTVGP